MRTRIILEKIPETHPSTIQGTRMESEKMNFWQSASEHLTMTAAWKILKE